MDEGRRYMVYRKYDEDERPNYSDPVVFYGWSNSKHVIKAFFGQRERKKYIVKKMYDEDIARIHGEVVMDNETMIDFVKLKSAASGEAFTLFTTAKEMRESEIKIQKMFRELSSFENVPGTGLVLEMFLLLKDYYADALHFIGFRPPEVEILFPPANFHEFSEDEEVMERIEKYYSGGIKNHGSSAVDTNYETDDSFSKIIYSLESFIKVMKDDM